MYHMTKYIAYCIYCLLPVAAFGFPPPRRYDDVDDVADIMSTSVGSDDADIIGPWSA